MAKELVPDVTIVSPSTVTTAVKYYMDDINQLKTDGADDVMQIHIQFGTDPACLGVFGTIGGVLMNASTNWVALPCPEYCKGKDGLLGFDDARALVTGS